MRIDEIQNRDSYISEKLKKFKLVDIREQYKDLIEEAASDNLGYEEFLIRLLIAEDEGKELRKTEKLIAKANFDSITSLNEIDYSFNHSLDKEKIEELGSLRFIEAKENVIIIGPPGVGKSMIATGIGRNACNAGHKVLFINAKELVDRLHDAMMEGNLQEMLKKLRK